MQLLIMFSFLFFQLFIHLHCLGQGGPCSLEELHSLQHGWSGLHVWVTFPFLTCALVVRGARRGRLLDTEVFHCPSVSPFAATAGGVGGRGRVFALPSWTCALSVPGTRVVISWEHGPHTAYFSHSQNKFTTHGVLPNRHTVFTK